MARRVMRRQRKEEAKTMNGQKRGLQDNGMPRKLLDFMSREPVALRASEWAELARVELAGVNISTVKYLYNKGLICCLNDWYFALPRRNPADLQKILDSAK